MTDINSIDVEKLKLFLDGMPLEEVFDSKKHKLKYIDKKYITEFFRNDRLIDVLRNNLTNYMSNQIINTFIDLVKYDLSRDERLNNENKFFISSKDNIIDKTGVTICNSLSFFKSLGLIDKRNSGKSGSEVVIDYENLLENILISAQILLKFKRKKGSRKLGKNALLRELKGYKNLNEYVKTEIKNIQTLINTNAISISKDFTEDQRNKVIEKLYRWTLEYKNKKLKNIQYTPIGDRVYFYYDFKDAVSNRDKQILDYLVYTGEIEAICYSNNSMRYALSKTPENIEIDLNMEVKTEETKDKKSDKIQKELDNILSDLNLEDISDNYYNAILQWSRYVGTRNKSIQFQVPDALKTLERMNITEDLKIDILNQTRQRSYTTVNFVIDDYKRKGILDKDMQIDNKIKNTESKTKIEKSAASERFEQFQRDCKDKIEELKKSGTDPHYEKFNQLREDYYKSKGWS